MKGMKMLKSAAALIAVSALTAQCSLLGLEEEENNDALLALALLAAGQNSCTAYCPNSSDFVSKSGDINASEVWGKCTVLTGIVYVKSGATLTVPAGSCVQGNSGTALFVERGGKIMAEGTAGAPIVFTSSKAEGNRSPQDWGGLVIIGNATSTESSATTEGPIGITYSGGSDDTDNSGVLKYVRIEYCGNEVAPSDELNCLSSYAVGSGTTYQYIQAHMGKDDGFEWWGGTVNASYLLATGIGDDAFDVDQGFRSTITSAIDYRYPASSGVTYSSDPRGLEWDGTGSGTGFASQVTLNKFSLIGDASTERAAKIREKTQATLTNGIYVSYPNPIDVQNNGPGGITGAANTSLSCTNIRGDQTVGDAASSGSTITCTPTSTSEARSTYVASDWSESNPSAAANLNVVANTGTADGTWWSGWTYWVNK